MGKAMTKRRRPPFMPNVRKLPSARELLKVVRHLHWELAQQRERAEKAEEELRKLNAAEEEVKDGE